MAKVLPARRKQPSVGLRQHILSAQAAYDAEHESALGGGDGGLGGGGGEGGNGGGGGGGSIQSAGQSQPPPEVQSLPGLRQMAFCLLPSFCMQCARPTQQRSSKHDWYSSAHGGSGGGVGGSGGGFDGFLWCRKGIQSSGQVQSSLETHGVAIGRHIDQCPPCLPALSMQPSAVLAQQRGRETFSPPTSILPPSGPQPSKRRLHRPGAKGGAGALGGLGGGGGGRQQPWRSPQPWQSSRSHVHNEHQLSQPFAAAATVVARQSSSTSCARENIVLIVQLQSSSHLSNSSYE